MIRSRLHQKNPLQVPIELIKIKGKESQKCIQ